MSESESFNVYCLETNSLLEPLEPQCEMPRIGASTPEPIGFSGARAPTPLALTGDLDFGRGDCWLLPRMRGWHSDSDMYEKILISHSAYRPRLYTALGPMASHTHPARSVAWHPGVKSLSKDRQPIVLPLSHIYPPPRQSPPVRAASHANSRANIVRARARPRHGAAPEDMLVCDQNSMRSHGSFDGRDGIADLLTAACYAGAPDGRQGPEPRLPMESAVSFESLLSEPPNNLLSAVSSPVILPPLASAQLTTRPAASLPAIVTTISADGQTAIRFTAGYTVDASRLRIQPTIVRPTHEALVGVQMPQQLNGNQAASQPPTVKCNTCTVCGTDKTSLWRRKNGLLVCNACALYEKLHGHQRPSHLLNQAIRRRNRSATTGTSRNRRRQRSAPLSPEGVANTSQ